MQTPEAPRHTPAAPDLRPMLTTEQLATLLGIRAQSIRQEYCRSGEYYGLRPKKLPNRLLRWPADSLEQLLETAMTAASRRLGAAPIHAITAPTPGTGKSIIAETFAHIAPGRGAGDSLEQLLKASE